MPYYHCFQIPSHQRKRLLLLESGVPRETVQQIISADQKEVALLSNVLAPLVDESSLRPDDRDEWHELPRAGLRVHC